MPLSDEKEPIRQGANVEFGLDDDEDGYSLQDIEVAGGKHDGTKKTSRVKEFIAKKKSEIENFNAKEFVQQKQHELQIFSLEEFNADKRNVVSFALFQVVYLL
jgi:hypothetical protein